MKNIKYRVWAEVNKCYLDMDSGYFYLAPNGTFYEITQLKNGKIDYNEVYADIQLYTGFKDKNDIEIYEGDIVKYVNELYTVDFLDGGFFLKCPTEFNSDNSDFIYGVHFSDMSSLENNCEVVGNIYENKELLK